MAEKSSAPVIEPALSRPSLSLVSSSNKDPLDEIFFRKPIRQHVKDFSAVLAVFALAVSAYFFLKNYSYADALAVASAGLLIFAFGYLFPRAMLPVWRGWMALGGVLQVVVTGAILSLIWTLMFIPLSAILRILGTKVMDLSYRADVPTYWISTPKDRTDFIRLERQY